MNVETIRCFLVFFLELFASTEDGNGNWWEAATACHTIHLPQPTECISNNDFKQRETEPRIPKSLTIDSRTQKFRIKQRKPLRKNPFQVSVEETVFDGIFFYFFPNGKITIIATKKYISAEMMRTMSILFAIQVIVAYVWKKLNHFNQLNQMRRINLLRNWNWNFNDNKILFPIESNEPIGMVAPPSKSDSWNYFYYFFLIMKNAINETIQNMNRMKCNCSDAYAYVQLAYEIFFFFLHFQMTMLKWKEGEKN